MDWSPVERSMSEKHIKKATFLRAESQLMQLSTLLKAHVSEGRQMKAVREGLKFCYNKAAGRGRRFCFRPRGLGNPRRISA